MDFAINSNKFLRCCSMVFFAGLFSVPAFGQQAVLPSVQNTQGLQNSAQQNPQGLQTAPGFQQGPQTSSTPALAANQAAVVPPLANAPSAPSPKRELDSVLALPNSSALLGPPASAGVVSSATAQPESDPNAPNTDPAVIAAARDQAFNQLTLNTLPMTPAQIQKLRNLFGDSNRAATAYPGGSPPKPVASTQIVTLEPGATPPIIRLAQGYVTSLVFLDATGAPWPIQSYDVGNPNAFNIQWDHTGNVLLIQSSALYTSGNLVIQLKGLNTPVAISLIPGQPIVDYRVDMRVQGTGPNAVPGAKKELPAAATNELLNVLDGVPPPQAKALTIPGSNSQAWLIGEKANKLLGGVKNQRMYLRTHLTLLSPAWIASMSSADGTNAYEIPSTPSILVSDDGGKIFNLRIEGY